MASFAIGPSKHYMIPYFSHDMCVISADGMRACEKPSRHSLAWDTCVLYLLGSMMYVNRVHESLTRSAGHTINTNFCWLGIRAATCVALLRLYDRVLVIVADRVSRIAS